MYFWYMENIVNPTVYLSKDSFSKPIPGPHALGIHFSEKTVSMLALTEDYNKVLALQVLQINEPLSGIEEQAVSQLIDYLINHHEWLTDSSLKITVLLPGKGFTLVPEEIIDTYNKEQLLEPNYQLQPNDVVLAEKLNAMPVTAVYALPWTWNNRIKNHFSDATIVHEDVFWIDHCLQALKNQKSSPSVILMTAENYVKILIIKDKELIYYNSFFIQSDEDILYYLHLAVQQHGLDIQGLSLWIAGSNPEEKKCLTLFKKYNRNVSLLNLPWFNRFSPTFSRKIVNRYLTLFSIATCG